MPGFFESLKRLAQGKPVFDVNDQQRGWTDKEGKPASGPGNDQLPSQQAPATQPQQPHQMGITKGNPATFPVVYVKHTKTHQNGSNMDVYGEILNNSRLTVELEEVTVAGRSRRLGGTLRPGGEREYLIYSGPRLGSEGSREAHLTYKTETGDYFQSIHDVEYQLENDSTYQVEELRLRLPIRDIYG